MTVDILKALGGLGLFLVGMTMLTDGLRALAGERLRRILRRSTSSPLKGAIAGAMTTAMVQSSSATTVATVGFVAAGLMSFQQSLGILFGANIGTTITGWLVAILGFKLDLGLVLMPLVLLGVFLRMFGPASWRNIGWALAGFGVLFIGIEALKEGMVAFRDVVTPDRFPSDTFLGRLKLVALGCAMTIVTQSSSAGVASAMAAVSVGAINFPQAAAMVIGMDVGTTVTALIATIGGTTAARRTGASHVVYNLFTGAMAFAMLYPLGWLAALVAARGVPFDAQIALVAFHSSFNLIGVVAILFVTPAFARLMMRLIPEHGTDLSRRLDRSLLSDPKAALDAADGTTRQIAAELFGDVVRRLAGDMDGVATSEAGRLHTAIDQSRRYVQTIHAEAGSDAQEDQLSLLHVYDHLDRLLHRVMQNERVEATRKAEPLRQRAREMAAVLAGIELEGDLSDDAERLNALRHDLHDFRETYRDTLIRQAVTGGIDPDDLKLLLDGTLWLQRSAYHAWRIVEHFRRVDAREGRAPDRAAVSVAGQG